MALARTHGPDVVDLEAQGTGPFLVTALGAAGVARCGASGLRPAGGATVTVLGIAFLEAGAQCRELAGAVLAEWVSQKPGAAGDREDDGKHDEQPLHRVRPSSRSEQSIMPMFVGRSMHYATPRA